MLQNRSHYPYTSAFRVVLTYSTTSSNKSFDTPHTGHVQSSGTSSQAVPGATLFSGSPTAGSYT